MSDSNNRGLRTDIAIAMVGIEAINLHQLRAIEKAGDKIMALIAKEVSTEAKVAYLAGALFAGMPDEDATIILDAYDKWRSIPPTKSENTGNPGKSQSTNETGKSK